MHAGRSDQPDPAGGQTTYDAKSRQFGTYVSLLPLTTQAEGVTLEGFKYPLKEYCMTSDNSLGVSNEITEETARITVKKGILIMIESKD